MHNYMERAKSIHILKLRKQIQIQSILNLNFFFLRKAEEIKLLDFRTIFYHGAWMDV